MICVEADLVERATGMQVVGVSPGPTGKLQDWLRPQSTTTIGTAARAGDIAWCNVLNRRGFGIFKGVSRKVAFISSLKGLGGRQLSIKIMLSRGTTTRARSVKRSRSSVNVVEQKDATYFLRVAWRSPSCGSKVQVGQKKLKEYRRFAARARERSHGWHVRWTIQMSSAFHSARRMVRMMRMEYDRSTDG